MLRQIISLIVISTAGLCFFIVLQDRLLSYEQEKRDRELQKAHEDALTQFSGSIERFATLMTGLRSYLNEADTMPSQQEVADFFAYQTDFLSANDSITISFLDTSHIFQYSFNKKQSNPGNLIGKSVAAFRTEAEIERLDRILKNDSLWVFPPINMVEGRVGIPLNFRVCRGDTVVGYIASIIDFKNIIHPVDQVVDTTLFVINFETSDGIQFDREQVYDKSRVYNNRTDILSAQKASIESEDWVKTSVYLYGQSFIISTAFRNETYYLPYLSWIFVVLYVLISGYTLFSFYKMRESQELSKSLKRVNKEMLVKNRQLLALNQTKDRFFSIIGHDLRGPLGSVISLIELAQDNALTDEDLRKVLKSLFPAAKNTVALMEDLLKWAHINNEEIKYEPAWYNLHELVEKVRAQVESNAISKDIQLVCEHQVFEDMWLDKDMISTALRNLIANAIKFSESGSKIYIRTFFRQQLLLVEVQDQGVGLSSDEIETILSTGKESTNGTKGETGYGLGLTISKAFINSHNGNFTIRSTKGLGSTFCFSIPQKIGKELPETV